MRWFQREPFRKELEEGLLAKSPVAARDYLDLFLNDRPVELGRVLQALTVLVVHLSEKDGAA
jgi:hypothetical protein